MWSFLSDLFSGGNWNLQQGQQDQVCRIDCLGSSLQVSGGF